MQGKELIFDLYGTLVDIRTEETEEVWEKTAFFFGFYGAHCTGTELKAAFQREKRRREAQAGTGDGRYPEIPVEQIMTELFAQQGVDDPALGLQAAQLFRVCSLHYIHPYPGAVQALKYLRRCGYRLWLLTNAMRAYTAYELRLLGMDALFDGILISSDYGFRKPDRRFFNALLGRYRLENANCLMIGNDRQTDIAGAAAVGISTLYLHTNITPEHQTPADPALRPGMAPADCRNWEWEGSDWNALAPLVARLPIGTAAISEM